MKPSPVFLPLAGLFGAGVAVRNLLYDLGIFRIHRVGLPVVSVGNLSAGGTGKTPFVVLVENKLRERGLHTAIVARGYGRKGRGTVMVTPASDVRSAGDEPAMLARRTGAPVVVDASKRKAAQWVARQGEADVIVVDDGFQHRSLHRDLDIVLLTRDEVLEGGRLLPAGYRREPLGALRRAGLVAVTGCADEAEFRQARAKLEWLEGVPVIGSSLAVESVLDVRTQAPIELSGRRVLALSGIGNPASFERTLRRAGAVVVAHQAYGDHTWFRAQDLRQTAERARSLGAQCVVTTEKDLVRIPVEAAELPAALAVVRVRLELVAGVEILDEQLARIATFARRRN